MYKEILSDSYSYTPRLFEDKTPVAYKVAIYDDEIDLMLINTHEPMFVEFDEDDILLVGSVSTSDFKPLQVGNKLLYPRSFNDKPALFIKKNNKYVHTLSNTTLDDLELKHGDYIVLLNQDFIKELLDF